MAKSASDRFLDNLCAAFGRWKVDGDTKGFYSVKLAKWKLSADEWSRALSLIVAECTDDHIPPLSTIYEFLTRTRRKPEDQRIRNWLTWADELGRMWACAVDEKRNANPIEISRDRKPFRMSPRNPGANDGAVMIYDEKLAAHTEPCSKHEARIAFFDGFLLAGGKQEDLARIIAAIDSKISTKPADHKGEFVRL